MKDLSIMVLFLLNLHWWLVAGLVTFATRKDDFKSRFPWTMFTTFVFAFLFEKYVSKDAIVLLPMGVVCIFMAFVTNGVLTVKQEIKAMRVCNVCHKYKFLRIIPEFREVEVAGQKEFSKTCKDCEKKNESLKVREPENNEDAATKLREEKYAHNLLSGKENSNKASTDKSTLSDTDSETLTEKLTELKGLLDSGLIDDQDYAEKKSELLKKF